MSNRQSRSEMGCRQSSAAETPEVENKSSGKYRAKIDPRILQKYEIQGNFSHFFSSSNANFSSDWPGRFQQRSEGVTSSDWTKVCN